MSELSPFSQEKIPVCERSTVVIGGIVKWNVHFLARKLLYRRFARQRFFKVHFIFCAVYIL